MEHAGLLICEETAQQPAFHILHLPPAYADGTTTFKSDLDEVGWAHLDALVACLLGRSRPTDSLIDDVESTSSDYRAQLHGAVMRYFPRPPAFQQDPVLHLAADNAVFLDRVDATSLSFGSPSDFGRTLFCSSTDFRLAKFTAGFASFWEAQFSGGDCDFSDVQFSGGDADFENARFSGGDARFRNAEFSGGNAEFANAHFSGGNADFDCAKFFDGITSFRYSRFSGGDTSFYLAKFAGKEAVFCNAEFSGEIVSFVAAAFSAETNFAGAHFLKVCEFGQSGLSGMRTA